MSKNLLIMDLSCPQCAERLTDGCKVRLEAYIKDNGQHGEMALSAVFGDYTVVTDMDVPEGTIVEFRCPKCESPLSIPLECKLCKAPMVSLNMTKGGYLEFCSRRGCRGHALGGVGDIDQMMNLMNRMFETPYD